MGKESLPTNPYSQPVYTSSEPPLVVDMPEALKVVVGPFDLICPGLSPTLEDFESLEVSVAAAMKCEAEDFLRKVCPLLATSDNLEKHPLRV